MMDHPIHIQVAPEEQETHIPVHVQPTVAHRPSGRFSLFADVRVMYFMLSLALFSVTVGMSYMSKKIVQELRVKDMQVNSLIDEIGDLRSENQLLYTQLTSNENVLGLVKESVIGLEERVHLVDEDGVFGLQSKLDAATNKLNSQTQAIESLMTAGLSLSDEDLITRDETLDVLIMGTNGRLTDTIMLASVNSEKETVSLFSIPRDLVVNGRRVNEYYYKYGIDPLRDEIETITGLYPEKYVVFDLASFEEVINLLGGVDVTLEEPLYDTMYPGPNFTYSTFSMEAGEHHLDGENALKFARSRKSTTDFDRADRQQQIIESVRDKVLDLNLLENTDEMVGIYSSVTDSIETDVDLISLMSYATRYKDYTIERGNVLSTTNYLYPVTGTDGAYLIVPRDASYQEIHNFIADVVKN